MTDEILQAFIELDPCWADIYILKKIKQMKPYSFIRIEADIDGKANTYAVITSDKELYFENKSPLPVKQKLST